MYFLFIVTSLLNLKDLCESGLWSLACFYGHIPLLFGFQVGPINHKRTLAFLNHFITHSVRFLNRFSCVCEEVSKYYIWRPLNSDWLLLLVILHPPHFTIDLLCFSHAVKVTVCLQGCLASKRCSASGLSGRYLNPYIKLMLIELAIKLYQEFWNKMNCRFFHDH